MALKKEAAIKRFSRKDKMELIAKKRIIEYKARLEKNTARVGYDYLNKGKSVIINKAAIR